MTKLKAWLEVEAHRAYLYRILIVVVPLLVAGGVLTDGNAQTVLGILAALLGFGAPALAAHKTSTKRDGSSQQ